MKTCYGYIRVSTQKQGEGVSLQEQKAAIEVFASHNDLSVIDWFEEKETAAKSGRPIFNRMLQQLRCGKASGLIMHKIDRSARNLKDWAIVSELPDQGIDVFIATETLDFTSRGGRLTADMLAVIASDFIRNQREETIKGIRGRLKQGLFPGRAPLGYLDNGRGQAKSPCPEKAPLIQKLFELYASGQHSLRSLHAEIPQLGLRNLNGGELSLHGLETILNNPFYTGTIVVKKTGEVFEGIHEPIVSAAQFRRVQDIKAGRCGPKVTRHNHLFRGLFRCGLCNRPMSPELQKGRVYYRCQGSQCATKTVREDFLDHHILAALQGLKISKSDAVKLTKEWNKGRSKSNSDKARKSLQLRIASTEKMLSRAADLLISGTLDEETYLARKRDATIQLAELKQDMQKIPDLAVVEANNAQFIELMNNLTELYQSLEPSEKRVFLEYTFSNRTVIGKEPCLEPCSWLQEAKTGGGVPFGDPSLHTDRTIGVPRELEWILKVFEERASRRWKGMKKDADIPQWKYNLKNQNPDDLPDVV